MRILIGLLAIATLAFGQTATDSRTANPQRFVATDVRADGDITHLRGDVVMKTPSAIIHAEDADFNSRPYSITIRGDSQWTIRPVHYLDPNDPPITDPSRLSATEIRQDRDITRLRGKVVMHIPGIMIYAESADFNLVTRMMDVHGDSHLMFTKPRIAPDDGLGPLIFSSALHGEAGSAPTTVQEAELEGAALGSEAAPDTLPHGFGTAATQGTSERKCVEFPITAQAVSRRSGDFIVGGAMGDLKAGVSNKVWWAPLHDPVSRDAKLVVRNAWLDDPSITSFFHSSQYARPFKKLGKTVAASVVDEHYAFYASGFSLPSPGRWMLTVTSVTDWGCYIVTVRP